MSENLIEGKQKKLTCSGLPLAVYREIKAHLQQVDGVDVDLLEQTTQEFDYLQSQVGGLWLKYLPDDDREDKVQSILNYYESKYGLWTTLES